MKQQRKHKTSWCFYGSSSLNKIVTQFGFLLVILAVTACGGKTAVSNPDAPTPTTDPVQAMQAALQATAAATDADRRTIIAQWQHNLADAEARWQANQVNDYTITVAYSPESTIDRSVYIIRFVDGEIVEESADCIAGSDNKGCVIERIDRTNLTVPGLLGMAKNALENDLIDVEYPLEFHETYGYPFQIGLETRSILGFYWRVESFTVNE